MEADKLMLLALLVLLDVLIMGVFKNRSLYNPDILPNLSMTKEEYKNNDAPTINHFYEKLLLLKDKVNNKTGKKIASERHTYMEGFLKQFYDEWNEIK